MSAAHVEAVKMAKALVAFMRSAGIPELRSQGEDGSDVAVAIPGLVDGYGESIATMRPVPSREETLMILSALAT